MSPVGKKKGKAPATSHGALRRKAETRLREVGPALAPPLHDGDAHKLVHELQVHRIELEMQNEALVAARGENEVALERYAELFDCAPVGFVVLTYDLVIREANEEAARLIGEPRSKLPGQRFAYFVVDDARPTFAAMIDGATRGHDKATCDVAMFVPGGPRTAHLTVRLLGRREKTFLLAIEDVSESKARQERLERAEAELRETDRRKDDFMAMLSHELRNPLAPIRNSLFVLSHLKPAAGDTSREYEVIDRQVTHLTRLVDDLLDVTRIARGKILLQREPVALDALVRLAVDDFRSTFRSAGVELHGEIVRQAVWVDGDPARLVQVLSNLLGNARNFTPPGGAVLVTLGVEAREAVLRVKDDGAGIAASHLERIFEPFLQGPQPLDRPRGGLGLGLATVKGIVELHGGRVRITSKGAGAGTEVSVHLPTCEGVDRPAPAPARPHGRPRRILLIDDNVDSAEMLKEVLTLSDHRVAVAFDGPSGLALARSFQPEVVICDVGLPGMDGYAVAQAFRGDAVLRGVLLIALSGYAQAEDRRRAAAAGFDHHFAKPPNFDALAQVLAEATPTA